MGTHAAEHCEGAGTGADPVRQCLSPAWSRIRAVSVLMVCASQTVGRQRSEQVTNHTERRTAFHIEKLNGCAFRSAVWRIRIRHILREYSAADLRPNDTAIAAAIIAEASLSVLGLGQQPPPPSWGRMPNTARQFLSQAPWMAVWPGFAIFSLVLSFSLLDEVLRDPPIRAWVKPKRGVREAEGTCTVLAPGKGSYRHLRNQRGRSVVPPSPDTAIRRRHRRSWVPGRASTPR